MQENVGYFTAVFCMVAHSSISKSIDHFNVCIFYFAHGSDCKVLRWVRLCVSLCPWGYLWNHTRVFTKFFVHVAYGCGSFLLQHCCRPLDASMKENNILIPFHCKRSLPFTRKALIRGTHANSYELLTSSWTCASCSSSIFVSYQLTRKHGFWLCRVTSHMKCYVIC